MNRIWRLVAGRLLGALAFPPLLASPAVAGDGASTGSAIGAAADRYSARRIERWSLYIEEASARFGIPEDWIRRVMRTESGGRTALGGRPIASRAGAMGLMQLMPGTWVEMRALHGLGPDPHDPRNNILAGTAYLRAMHDRFGYPGVFAAYNAGPGRYAEHLAGRRRLPGETVAYVAAIGSMVPSAGAKFGTNTGSRIFVTVGGRRPQDEAALKLPAASRALFVPLGPAAAERP